MVIFTPNGLKIRLDQERVDGVLAPIRADLDYQEVLLDVESWADLPGAIFSVTALLTAILSKSWVLTIVLACLAFLFTDLYQQFFYSRFVANVFCLFLGSWLIALPFSVGVAWILYRHGALGVGMVQLLLVMVGVFGLADFLLLVNMPVRIALRYLLRYLVGCPIYSIGSMEFAFVKILDARARALGVKLDWSLYKRREGA